MASKRFVLKRLLLLVPVLFGVATLVFAILHLAPGDPARLIAGQRASREQYRAVREALGLNQPLWRQYLEFLYDAVRFDFGRSYQPGGFGRPVREVVADTLPVTVELAVYGQLIGILVGIPLGILSALKQDSLTDHATRIGALSGISIPIFWSGPLLILAVSTPPLKLFPASGRIGTGLKPGDDFVEYTGMVTVDTLLSGNIPAFLNAAEQRPELDTDDGDDRDERVPEAVFHQRYLLALALRAGGPDVILSDHLEHRRPHHSGDECRRVDTDDECRQEQVPGGVEKRGDVPGQKRVHGDHAGEADEVDARLEPHADAVTDGEQLQRRRRHGEDEQRTRPEDGDRDATAHRFASRGPSANPA